MPELPGPQGSKTRQDVQAETSDGLSSASLAVTSGGASLYFATFRAALKLTRAVLLNALNDEASAALGTGLRNRPISQREFASRIVRTAVKRSALALLGDYFPGPTLGTAHASCLLLDVFALRIIRASGERSVAALL